MSTRVFNLPDLGEGLTEAALVRWMVSVGDTVSIDQPIAEVETAKSIVELPSPYAGVVVQLHGTEGDALLTGSPVLEVLDERAPEAAEPAVGSPESPGAPPSPDEEREAYRHEERAGSGNVLIGYGTGRGPAKGRRRRARGGIGGARSGATSIPALVHEAPAPVRISDAPRRTVAVRSPIVRRLARELGVDPHRVRATGSDGAITRADVLRAADAPRADASEGTQQDPVTAGAHTSPLPVARVERFSPLRRVVSETLSRSRAEIPEATVWVDVDLTELWELRPLMAADGERPPSLTAILARYTLLALQQYPILASRLAPTGDAIEIYEGVNLGIAVDTSRGLMVPVMRDAHAMSIASLDRELRSLSATARDGRTPPEQLRGSTFTLNNYGGLGVDGSAAIINHPEVAMLGIGRVLERAWVVDGRVQARRIAQLSLVFDHRVCDGGYAAGFLRAVTDMLEHPLRAYARV